MSPGSPASGPGSAAHGRDASAPTTEGSGSWAEAWAPVSVGNISVGFDLLGHTLGFGGDRVRVALDPENPGVRIHDVQWEPGTVPPGAAPPELPRDARRNTAGAALLAFLEGTRGRGLPPDTGLRVEIRKGIPLGSGMGGSAASAVAALTAANHLLPQPLEPRDLYPFALAGEAVASGTLHGDNVGPQLLGGVVLALSDRLIPLPWPEGWDLHCALVHPHQVLETRRAREVLEPPFPLEDVVAQSERLARFLTACHLGDLSLLRGHLADALVEPRRAPLIPGFQGAREAALDAGALGAGISGGGPSLFAWFEGETAARHGATVMREALAGLGIGADAWSAPVVGPPARVESHG
jgi:homoserine kinase